MEGTDFVLNRFFPKLFWTFTTFPSQGTVNRIGYPYIWMEVRGGDTPKSRLNLRSAWLIKNKNLFGHFIEISAEDSCRAGKDRVRGSAGEWCGGCGGRNSRRGWPGWRGGSGCRTAEAAEGEDPAGSLYRGKAEGCGHWEGIMCVQGHAESCSPLFSLFFLLSLFPDISWLKSNFLISLDKN